MLTFSAQFKADFARNNMSRIEITFRLFRFGACCCIKGLMDTSVGTRGIRNINPERSALTLDFV